MEQQNALLPKGHLNHWFPTLQNNYNAKGRGRRGKDAKRPTVGA